MPNVALKDKSGVEFIRDDPGVYTSEHPLKSQTQQQCVTSVQFCSVLKYYGCCRNYTSLKSSELFFLGALQ